MFLFVQFFIKICLVILNLYIFLNYTFNLLFYILIQKICDLPNKNIYLLNLNE